MVAWRVDPKAGKEKVAFRTRQRTRVRLTEAFFQQRLPEAGQLGCPKALLVWSKLVTGLSYCGVALNRTNGAL